MKDKILNKIEEEEKPTPEEDLKFRLAFDPNRDEVVGVFDDEVHVKFYDCIGIIPKNEYLRIWKKWLEAKSEYCVRYNEYCGFGYAYPDKYELTDKKIFLNEWDKKKRKYKEVFYDVYFIYKYEKDGPCLEHG